MFKTSGEREPLFFLKDVKTVVIEDTVGDYDSQFSATQGGSSARKHTRSHTVLQEQMER
jgi:hypothetical protein